MGCLTPPDRRPTAVDRRGFLRSSAIAGAALATGAGCGPGLEPGAAAQARTGGQVRGAEPPVAPERTGPDAAAFELAEVSIGELAAALADGRRTARSVTEAYLARIAQIDREGPTLRSVIETNPDALDIADALDRERADGRVRSPLHGVPILVKDNIDTADRMTTTAGSLALEGSIPAEDSSVARRLREAGVILLGKANLSEWANFRSTRSSSGWSARGGQCRNPYALDRNPCGSSSGSGAAGFGPTWPRPPSAPRPTAPSSAHPRPTASSASSRPSASSAGPASCPFRRPRTPPARWRAPSATRRCCSAPSRDPTRATRRPHPARCGV